MRSMSGEPRVDHYNPLVLSSSSSLVAWPAPFSQSQASKSLFSEHLCVGETMAEFSAGLHTPQEAIPPLTVKNRGGVRLFRTVRLIGQIR